MVPYTSTDKNSLTTSTRPVSYQDVGVAVSRYDRANVHDGRRPSLRLDGVQLHVVRHHHMCQDGLEQHCGKVASRAAVTEGERQRAMDTKKMEGRGHTMHVGRVQRAKNR